MSRVSELRPRLEAEYVADTVGRLEARIRARFPDRRLGNVAAELGATVPEIQDGFEQSKARRRRCGCSPASPAC